MVKHQWDDKPSADAPAPVAAPPAAGMVRIKCIVDNHPWTDARALERDEEADVPQAIAKAMEEKKQVERVK